MEKKLITIAVILAVLAAVGSQTFYTVHQTERAIVLQLGEPMRGMVEPGLHLKIPFIQNVIKLDARILTYDSNPAEALTSDKKTIVVDNYARWRITDPLKFYRTLRTVRMAQARLVDIVYSELRVVIGQYTMEQVVNSDQGNETGAEDLPPLPTGYTEGLLSMEDENAAREAAQAVQPAQSPQGGTRAESGRQIIMEKVIVRANAESQKYGVEVIDVRIKRIDLPTENQRAIFDRMRAERERQAKQYRSEGEEEYRRITSGADKDKAEILAKARREAEKIRGEGDATATRLFAEALSRSPEFYEFTRSLEAYKKSLKDNSRLLLPLGTDFLRHFK